MAKVGLPDRDELAQVSLDGRHNINYKVTNLATGNKGSPVPEEQDTVVFQRSCVWIK